MTDKEKQNHLDENSNRAEDQVNQERKETGASEEPQIFALKREGSSWVLNRRSFIAAAAAAAAPIVINSLGIGGGGTEHQNLAMAAADDNTILAHEDTISALTISPDGRFLVSGSRDKKVKLWSLPDGGHIKSVAAHSLDVSALAVSPDSQSLVSGGANDLKVWSLPALGGISTIPYSYGAQALAFNPQKRQLAVATQADGSNTQNKGVIKVVTFPEMQVVQTIDKITTSGDLCFTPNGEYLITPVATATNAYNIGAWSVWENKMGQTLPAGSNNPSSTAVSPVDKVVYGSIWPGGSNPSKIRAWSLIDAKQLYESAASHSGAIHALAVTPDGKILASGAQDNAVILWSLPNLTQLKRLDGHTKPVLALAISPDGKILASAGEDKRIILWNLPEGTKKVELMDLTINTSNKKGSTYTAPNSAGTMETFTLPCGSPLPAGAVCICNCVPGQLCSCVSVCSCVSYVAPSTHTYTYHYWYPN